MCFIYSLWTDTDTKWLDGSKDGSYNQRGNCAVSADATKTAKIDNLEQATNKTNNFLAILKQNSKQK